MTGQFWQGRFDCQPLLDERAIVTYMIYDDLNPIRAGMAKSLESSDYTSIKQRLINFDANSKGVVGSMDAIKQFMSRTGRRWMRGLKDCYKLSSH